MTNEIAVLQADQMARMIPDGSVVALTGSGIFLEPDAILAALERLFLETGHPRDLTLIHALGIGDGATSGLNRLAHDGMVRRVIGGHWSWSPTMQKLARENRIEAYSFPAGVISTLMRDSGAGRPGLISRIGLGTFADPRLQGGKCNARATEDLVEVVQFDGQEYLRYKPFKIDFAFVRGTEVDRRGNISFHREPNDLDSYAVALAAHNTGGKVFAQVESQRGSRILPARLARLPGILIKGVVLAPDARRTYHADAPTAGGEPCRGQGAGDAAPHDQGVPALRLSDSAPSPTTAASFEGCSSSVRADQRGCHGREYWEQDSLRPPLSGRR